MLGKLLVSFLFSASPFGEMKIALPIAMNYDGINEWGALFFCIAGNLMVYPLVERLMSNYGAYLFKSKTAKKGLIKVRTHTKNKTGTLISKYGFWGLMIFVMVPLPGTGAYLGTVAAYIFGIDKEDAFPAISIGIILSGFLLFATIKAGEHSLNLIQVLFQ